MVVSFLLPLVSSMPGQEPSTSFTLAVTFSTGFGFGVVPYKRGSTFSGGAGMGAVLVGPSW